MCRRRDYRQYNRIRFFVRRKLLATMPKPPANVIPSIWVACPEERGTSGSTVFLNGRFCTAKNGVRPLSKRFVSRFGKIITVENAEQHVRANTSGCPGADFANKRRQTGRLRAIVPYRQVVWYSFFRISDADRSEEPLLVLPRGEFSPSPVRPYGTPNSTRPPAGS